jgi:alkanesulfonate monooxygenase SsuD/methylene tetrahydromethanopterin reductase-like flavin-dependent oxidoreductase (luciferase family)
MARRASPRDGTASGNPVDPLGVTSTSTPFAPGSVSLRLYPHNELGATEVIHEISAQAGLGLDNGFDGVMTSEHHGGFAGYLCNPLQVTSFILEDHDQGWAAPCPMVLPLRPTAQVAEEVAWLNARHPGRVGLGVCAGALPLDFEAMDVPLAEAVPRFKAALPEVVDMLRGRNLRGLEGDQALQLGATTAIPVLSAAASTTAARRAARCGAGILMEGMSTVERLASLCAAYDEAGGTQSKVLIRRVWLGEPLTELVEKQRQVYQSYSSGSFPADQTLTTTDPTAMAEALHQMMLAVGADAVNLRIHLPGLDRGDARRQIVSLAEDVVPRLRDRLEKSG